MKRSDEENINDRFDHPNELIDCNPSFFGMIQSQKKQKHQCTIFGHFDKGTLANVGHIPLFRIETSKVEDFLGRTTEMHEVISCINNKRTVNVKGVPGIGKTTLVKAVSHYLDER